ncbi:MAG: NPXTG-anchored protein [Clostridia bacterium]|nr:NPXTG-anchored protein [Clostridia bacterium]
MKKKVLAVLLAFCMIAGTCVLFASASFSVGVLLKTKSGSALTADNLTTATSGSDYNIPVTVTPITDASLSQASKGKAITADDVDSLVTFKQGTSTLKFKGKLDAYFTVSGTVGDTTVITFTDKNNTAAVYKVTDTITDEEITNKTNVSGKLADAGLRYYDLSASSVTAKVTKWENKLCSLTMGVRFYGKTYDNLVAAEIAKVSAQVNRTSGAVSKITTSVSDTIEDLMTGDTVILTAALKDPAEKEYYAFNCWVDASGNVFSTADTIEIMMDGSNVALYACFVELKSRHTIDYISNGNGKLVVFEEKAKEIVTREVFGSKDATKEQISILEGRDFAFTIVPDEGYEIAKVVIDGKTDVASFRYVLDGTEGFLKALQTLIAATGADRKLPATGTAEGTAKRAVAEGTYKFKNVKEDHTIEVTFAKIDNFEAPEGMELPTMEAGTVEFQTGAAAENGGSASTTVPSEDGAAADGSAIGGVVNPATGSASAIGVFAALSLAAGAAFVTAKKKED